jgi:hypothetical protein
MLPGRIPLAARTGLSLPVMTWAIALKAELAEPDRRNSAAYTLTVTVHRQIGPGIRRPRLIWACAVTGYAPSRQL